MKYGKIKEHISKVFKTSEGDTLAEVLWENGKTAIEIVQDFTKESQLSVNLVCQDCGKIIEHEIDLNKHSSCKGFPIPILPSRFSFDKRVENNLTLFPTDVLSQRTVKQSYKGKFILSPENRGASPGARKSLFGEYFFQPLIADYLN